MPVYDVLGVALTRQQAAALLYKMMSDASELCWYAGWMAGTEEELPAMCRTLENSPLRQNVVAEYVIVFGMWSRVPEAEAKLMCLLADALGHWISFEQNAYIPICDGGDGHGQRRA